MPASWHHKRGYTLLPTTQPFQENKFIFKMDSNANLSLTPTHKMRRISITTIEQWSSAFIRFVAVYSNQYPLETSKLMKYMKIIRDIAN